MAEGMQTPSLGEEPSLMRSSLEVTAAVVLAALLAGGISLGCGFRGAVAATSAAAALCLVPGWVFSAAMILGRVRGGRLVWAVAAVTFLRPAVGLAAALFVKVSLPEVLPAFLLGVALSYPASLALETRFLVRLTGAAGQPMVSPTAAESPPTND